ncbi:unnamed protein product, partial [Iphiclides podalirius]
MKTDELIAEPVFTTSRYGRPVILLDGYRFNKKTGSPSKAQHARWVCVKDHHGCRAKLVTVSNKIIFSPVYTFSRCGKPVILFGNNRYNKETENDGPRVRWVCAKINSHKCPGTVTTYNNIVVHAIFLESRNGRPVIQIGNYRFNMWSGSRGPRARWICVKVHSGCPATLITLDNVIVKQKPHNH